MNSPDSLRLKTVVISEEYDIKLFTYQFMPSDYNSFHNEYIEVQNIKISIDSLLNAEHNEVMEGDPYIDWQNVSYFSYNKHNYVLVSGGSRNFYMIGIICSHLLFDFTNNRFNNAWIFYNGYCSNSVFNDFDGDGILDYVKWGQNSSEINLFHFTNNTLIKDSIYYVTVHPSKDEIKDQERGMFNSYTDIDTKRSKWFYPLK